MDTVTSAALGARLGFTSLEEEVRVDDAPVTGTIPDWLRGSLMRVSPGLLDIGGKPVGHWFDGMGMLNVFTIADGRVEAPHHIPFNFHQQYFPDKPHSVEAGV